MKRSILVVALLTVLLPGCGEQNLQSPILIRVSDINEGSPTFADILIVIEEGDPSAIPPDPRVIAIPTSIATIRITNKPYNTGVITEPSTFVHDFQLTRYEVTWRRADGGVTSGIDPSTGNTWLLSDFDFETGTTEIIPVNTTVEMAMQIVPISMKTTWPFINARGSLDGFAGEDFRLIVDIVFYGHVVTAPNTEVTFQASSTVEIADFADE